MKWILIIMVFSGCKGLKCSETPEYRAYEFPTLQACETALQVHIDANEKAAGVCRKAANNDQ